MVSLISLVKMLSTKFKMLLAGLKDKSAGPSPPHFARIITKRQISFHSPNCYNFLVVLTSSSILNVQFMRASRL